MIGILELFKIAFSLLIIFANKRLIGCSPEYISGWEARRGNLMRILGRVHPTHQFSKFLINMKRTPLMLYLVGMNEWEWNVINFVEQNAVKLRVVSEFS